jgi:hypothetical protein
MQPWTAETGLSSLAGSPSHSTNKAQAILRRTAVRSSAAGCVEERGRGEQSVKARM